MAKNLKLKELGMDTMEILYYERKEARKKAYAAKKRKKADIYKVISQTEQDSDTFYRAAKKSIYYMC